MKTSDLIGTMAVPYIATIGQSPERLLRDDSLVMVDVQEQAKIISLISTKWFVDCDLWSVGCGHDILESLEC